MNNTYLELYNKWHESFMFSAHGSSDPAAKPYYEELKKWCIENPKEFKDSILEQLKQEPDWAVGLLDDIYGEKLGVKAESYVGLKDWCNFWVLILENRLENYKKGGILPYIYKDYDEYQEYMKDHYIAWNPFKEEDPNITFDEFKQGKRNIKKS